MSQEAHGKTLRCTNILSTCSKCLPHFSEIMLQSSWQKSGLLTFVPLLLLCFSFLFLFCFFPSQKEVEESSRLYMLSLVTSISFWNSCVCMPCLCVASGSHWGAEIQFSMLWLSEELLTLRTSLFSAYYIVQRGKHERLEWSPPFGARWGVCNVHRHHVSRVQVVYLVDSGFLLYASCLNQVFTHFSSVVLFHSMSILVHILTLIKFKKYHCGL